MGHQSTSTNITLNWKEYPSLLQLKNISLKAPHDLTNMEEKITIIELVLPLLCDENTAAEIEYVKYMFNTYVPAVTLRITFSQSLDQNLCTQGHKA